MRQNDGLADGSRPAPSPRARRVGLSCLSRPSSPRCLPLPFYVVSTAFHVPFRVFPLPFAAFRCCSMWFPLPFMCLSVCFRCLSLPSAAVPCGFHCLSCAFPCVSAAFHVPFMCLFRVVSTAFHCIFLCLHCLSCASLRVVPTASYEAAWVLVRGLRVCVCMGVGARLSA